MTRNNPTMTLKYYALNGLPKIV